MDDKLRLHIGCGKRDFGERWIHIDYQKLPHVKYHDVRKLPFKDGSVSIIYTSHMIAYFSLDEMPAILKEWNRVLKPKGVLRIATPDWDVLRSFNEPMMGPIYGKMNEPPIYHKVIYSFSTLKDLLEKAGFYKIKRYNHKHTEHARYDDHSAAYYNDTLISLNVECNA